VTTRNDVRPAEPRGYPTIRVAAVQAASAFLDLEESTRRVCELVRECGRQGAELIAFPEGFLPAHPTWFHFHTASSRWGNQLSSRLFRESVEVPGPETAAIAEAARDAGAFVVLGACERVRGTDGTLFNTQIYFGPDGTLVGRHRKLTPTAGERLVHAVGFGDTFGTVAAPFGRVSSLICGENTNPLAIFALAAEHTRVHVMSWPPHLAPLSRPMADRVSVASQAFATMTKSFVVSSCGVVDEDMIDLVKPDDEGLAFLRDPAMTGGSVVVSPNGTVLTGPLGSEPGVLYADLDLSATVAAKVRADYAGHYNRPDVFQLRLVRQAPALYEVQDCGPGEEQLASRLRADARPPSSGSVGSVAGPRPAGPLDGGQPTLDERSGQSDG
jgi:aliphatic nitrilase